MKVFIFLILSFSFMACKKKSKCKVAETYEFIKGRWDLIYSEEVTKDTYWNSYDTVITENEHLGIVFGDCFSYKVMSDYLEMFVDSGYYETSGNIPNFTFEFDLNHVNNYMYNNLPAGSSTSPYFKVNQDTLWAIGSFVHYAKYETDSGTAWVSKKISHVFLRQ